jgi:hypothetical protein
MSNFRFLPEADVELGDAVEFYNGRESGVGFRFLDAVEATIRQITNDPASGPFIGKRVQRRPVLDFPFDVLYFVHGAEVIIVTLRHYSRRDNYWQRRL